MADSAAWHPVAVGLGRRAFKTVVEPPGRGPGYWAGAPSAVWHRGEVWLAYRLRRPVDAGRGYANVLARSPDGYSFETVAGVTSAQFQAASLERPALVAAPDGTWRLFVSCSTEGSKHWWIEVLEAASPERFGAQGGRMVLPGDHTTAWKDPVVAAGDDGWRMWPCRHDITVADDADRMESWYATSADGERWDLRGPALRPTPGTWDQRGVRISAVVEALGGPSRWLAFYDGRASAEENWHERTGVALSPPAEPDHPSSPDQFRPVGPGPLVTAPSIRYVSPVALPDGSWLVYYEAQREDGAHELRVEHAEPAVAPAVGAAS
ncbi:MAG TPA: hypothetical protein VHT30_10375 [Acidimicrobiales bacterium]|jgi:hypothetical protein|nr:hypothetical protein [Acidimicrobiales bacterium]